jgi:hypothetical protein
MVTTATGESLLLKEKQNSLEETPNSPKETQSL